MRHVLVHDYANVVSATLYDTAINDIPKLRKQVEKYLIETDWKAWESVDDTFEDNKADAVYEQNVKIAKKMKAKGYSNSDIADITGLSIEEIESSL